MPVNKETKPDQTEDEKLIVSNYVKISMICRGWMNVANWKADLN